ncbi:hypothetical protein O181_108585 [Austropuccinia psidii MF-1]|uniref:Reverse transcriptase Ty1/copia-type domain-containing protein n=1 Tax=Austropuccinia psidii MF-1 TaxID=1389203 RepID=A0A9Q3JWP9_9BASI|nr:hypothetical protein [Austropuccinia psidii MF-1]
MSNCAIITLEGESALMHPPPHAHANATAPHPRYCAEGSTSVIRKMTILWRRSPFMDDLIKSIQTFGFQVIISLQKGHWECNFGPSGNEGVFLGFENDNTSYCIFRTIDKKVVTTRHAIFNKNLFPKVSGDIGDLIVAWNSSNWPATVDELRADEQREDTSRVVDEVHVPHENASNTKEPSLEPHHPSSPRPRINIIGPQHPTCITSNILEQNIFPYSRWANALLTTSGNDPKTFRQALLSPNKEAWSEAINKELNSMACLNVWEVVDHDPGYRLIGVMWVLKTKCNHLGKIVKHNAHLCAQGFTQTAVIDYNKTYSSTGHFNSLHTLIAFPTKNSLPFHQIDIKRTFLNASLNETVYLLIPQGLDLARGTLSTPSKNHIQPQASSTRLV